MCKAIYAEIFQCSTYTHTMRCLFALVPSEETGDCKEGNDGEAGFGKLNKLVEGKGVIFWCGGRDFNEDRREKRNKDGEEDESHVGYEFSHA